MALDFPSNPEVGDTHETAGTVYTWTGDRWLARSYQLEYPVPIYTNMVLTTPRDDGDPDQSALADRPEILENQEQVNEFILAVAEKGFKATTRAEDQIDFLQNSVGKGQWINGNQTIPDDESECPKTGEFWTDSKDFNKITKFKFNDTPLPGFNTTKSLDGTKVGDYITAQCTDTNSFGQYVIKGMTVGDRSKAGRVWRTFDVSLVREQRGQGELLTGTKTAVTTSRPLAVIVQDNQPVVSSRGILWYREADDHLFISNWADGETGDGEQWTDLTAGGDFLPLTGGTIDGQVIINKGPLLVNGAQVVELPTGGDLFTVLNSDNGDAILAINGAGSGKYLGKQTVDENIATLGYCNDNYLKLKGGTMTGDLVMNGHKITGLGDATQGANAVSRNYGDGRYLQLKAGGTIEAEVKFTEDNRLEMGGTYNNNIIDGKQDYTSNSLVPTLGYVNHQIQKNLSIGSLSPRDKMYLQGFYPWRVGEGSQANNPGDFLPKKSDYNVDLDPSTWSYLYFSVVDAYGQDLAGTFMNHMEMNKPRELQLWIARENGTKVCTIMGKMRCRDQNFEERFTVDLDVSDKDLVVSPKWDTASLEISRGEILWIKCSAWGN